MSDILFFDTETTGLPQDHAAPATETDKWPRLVQLAWGRYSPSWEAIEERAVMIRPEGFEIPAEAARVHGITDAEARREGIPVKDALEQFRRALGGVGLVVGHNVEFDLRVLDAECARSGQPSLFVGLDTLCTMRGAAEYCKERGVTDGKWPTLEELYGAVTGRLLRSPGEAHRANKDVWATAACYRKLASGGHLPPPQPYAPSASSKRPRPQERNTLSTRTARPEGQIVSNAGYVAAELRRALVECGVPARDVDRFHQRVSAFEVHGLPAPSESQPIDPVLAVAHNYVVRGIPTRASVGLSCAVLSSTFGDSFLGARETGSGEVVLDLHDAAFAGLAAKELAIALRRFPEVSLGEVAETTGTGAYWALEVMLALTEAAQVHKALLLALRGFESVLPDAGVRVYVAGRPEAWGAAVVDDLDDLLRHLSTLREGRPAERRMVPVGAAGEADLVVEVGPDTQPPSTSEVPTVRVLPTYEPPDPAADGETTTEDEEKDPTSRSLPPYLTRLWMASPVAYPSLGAIEEVRGGSQVEEQFAFADPGVEAALRYVLRNAFRKVDFRPGQPQIVDRALRGLDVIGLLPTGGGKSLTYQMCALLQPGVTVVVDPINSLMRDQHDKLVEHGITASAYINAFNDRDEREANMERLAEGLIQIVFVSPERFQIQRFRTALSEAAANGVRFSYAVIDEAHCVSEWGHDFRHSYLKLADDLRRFCATGWERLPLFGLTATASFDVLADVQRELGMREEAIVTLPPEAIDRKELHFQVLPVEAFVELDAPHYERERVLGRQKYRALRDLIGEMPSSLEELGLNAKPEGFFQAIGGRYANAGVIFCRPSQTSSATVSSR